MEIFEGLRGKQGDDLLIAVVVTTLILMALWKLVDGIIKERK